MDRPADKPVEKHTPPVSAPHVKPGPTATGDVPTAPVPLGKGSETNYLELAGVRPPDPDKPQNDHIPDNTLPTPEPPTGRNAPHEREGLKPQVNPTIQHKAK